MTLELTPEQDKRLKLLLKHSDSMRGRPLDIIVVGNIKKDAQNGLSTDEINKKYGVSKTTIDKIKRDKYRTKYFKP